MRFGRGLDCKMLFKIIIIFLLAMALVGMIGKLVFPSAYDRALGRKRANCRDCGRPMVGKTCICGGRRV